MRLTPSRSSAQALAERAIIRLNGRRIDRAHAPVRVGDLITFPQGELIRVIRVERLPDRRGGAPEAQLCYSAIIAGGDPEGIDPGWDSPTKSTPTKLS